MRAVARILVWLVTILSPCGLAAANGLLQFGVPTPLDPEAASDRLDDINPELANDGNGTWIAVWWTTRVANNIANPGQVLVARSTDHGETWSAPEPLSSLANSSQSDLRPRLATDGEGNWVAAWTSTHTLGGTLGSDFDQLVVRSSNNGTSWSAPIALNSNAATDVGTDVNVALATDGLGNWLAAWESNDPLGSAIGSDYDILVSRSTNGGASWSSPVALDADANVDDNDDTNVALATDAAGNWLAIWQSSPSAGSANVLASHSFDAGESWSPAVTINQIAGYHIGPHLATDGSGNWIAAWASNVTSTGAVGRDFDIYSARSSNAGASWTNPALLNVNADSDSGDDYFPRIATDGSGSWIAVWSSDDSLDDTLGRKNFDVLSAQSSDLGASWSAPAPLNANAACDVGDDLDARVLGDGEGDWLALWGSRYPLGDTIGKDSDILIAHLDSSPLACQSRDQQACITALNANFEKVARVRGRAIAKCIKNQSRKGESASACLALPDPKLDKARQKTSSDEARRCAEPPDFGPLEADPINEAAVDAEDATLAAVFGVDIDMAIVSRDADRDAEKCQQAIVKTTYDCQHAFIKEFNRCKKNFLKKGAAVDASGIERCLGYDPKQRIAKKCDPVTGQLAAKVLPRSCEGVDLSGVAPGCDTASAAELAECVDATIACNVCRGVNAGDALDEDCDLFDDGVDNASCG